MLVEMAIGDAFGAGFEYVPDAIVEKHNDGRTYRQHQKHKLALGHYTDDTQMAIGVAEALLSERHWNHLTLAEYFLNGFKRDSRKGYAGGFYYFLSETKTPEEFVEKIISDSEKSGGAMRSPPLGVIPDLSEMFNKAEIQASLTHNTYWGIKSAQVSALITHYFYYNIGEKAKLQEWVAHQMQNDFWGEKYNESVESLGYMHVKAAMTAIVENDNMEDILIHCVDFTGDVDTVAAIALHAASLSTEVKQNLHKGLLDGLENKAYGKDYLAELDKKLFQKYPRK